MNPLYRSPVQIACYDNDAYIPEVWARESLEILFENMVVAQLVHRDFEQEIAKFGDTVHTRRPAESKIKRRTDVTAAAGLNQATDATDVPVVLNQWFNQTFTIYPGEMSKSFEDLVQVHLAPRMKAMARSIDRAVLGGAAASFGSSPTKRAGRLEALDASNVYGACVEVDMIFNQNKAPQDGRKLVLSPSAKAQMLLCDKFVKALERGDGGQTLATAQLGTILNLETYMSQNVNCVQLGADVDAAKTLDAVAYAASYAGALASADCGVAAGEFVTVSGNDQPTYVTAVSGEGTDAITLNEPLKYAVKASAPITRFKGCVVATSRPAGWSEEIDLKTHTSGKGPQVGQLIAFAAVADGVTGRKTYTVIEVVSTSGTTTTVLLDRPLDAAITADTTGAFPGPYGSINLALHKNALALVTRPLAVASGAGMMCAVQSADGIGVRIAMQDQINVGRVVSIDMLAGVAVLDQNLCVPLIG